MPTRNMGQKGFYAQEPHRVLLGFNSGGGGEKCLNFRYILKIGTTDFFTDWL